MIILFFVLVSMATLRSRCGAYARCDAQALEVARQRYYQPYGRRGWRLGVRDIYRGIFYQQQSLYWYIRMRGRRHAAVACGLFDFGQ